MGGRNSKKGSLLPKFGAGRDQAGKAWIEVGPCLMTSEIKLMMAMGAAGISVAKLHSDVTVCFCSQLPLLIQGLTAISVWS